VHPSLKVKFNKDFQNINNSEFVQGTALIAYPGDNRNNSDITELAFNNAMHSLSLIPVVGHWLPEKQNFGGHDITIEWNGNQLVLKDNTVPYGVVKENHNAEWIDIEENGITHKYLKADVVLWYGRYQEQVQKIIDDGINQSMEINVKSYSSKTNGNIQIDSFEYSALCLLGKDIDEYGNKGEENIEPCFESASITIDKFSVNEQFQEQFNQLIQAVNSSLKGGEIKQMKNTKEGEIMDEKLELLKKYNLTTENISFSIEDLSLEEIESKIKEHFALLASQKEKEIINALRDEEFTDRWGDEYRKYSYVDYNETEVFAYDRQDNWNLYGFTYSMNGDKVIIDFASKKRKKFEIVDFVEGETMFSLFPQEAIDYAIKDTIKETEDKFTSINTELETLKSQITEYENKFTELETIQSELDTIKTEFETLTTENNQLKEFKQNIEFKIEIENKRVEMEGLIEEFESVLNGNEEFEQIKKDVADDEKLNIMEYNTMETKLYAIVGKVKFEKKKKDKVKKNVAFSRVNIEIDNGNNIDDLGKKEYGEASKYFPKKN
jgi:hypothetical protein